MQKTKIAYLFMHPYTSEHLICDGYHHHFPISHVLPNSVLRSWYLMFFHSFFLQSGIPGHWDFHEWYAILVLVVPSHVWSLDLPSFNSVFLFIYLLVCLSVCLQLARSLARSRSLALSLSLSLSTYEQRIFKKTNKIYLNLRFRHGES